MGIPYGYIEDKVLYRAAFADIEALRLTDIVEEEIDKHVTDFEEKFNRFNQKLVKITEKIDSSNNKGSFLSALLNIKETIVQHEGLGDYQAMLDKIALYESLLVDFVNKNRLKNSEIKQALLAELHHVLENNDMHEAFEQIKDLKQRWIKTGAAEDHVKEELDNQFKEGVDRFFDKRKSFLDAKSVLKSARVEDYQSIIDTIQSFIESGDVLKNQNKVKDLQKQWKEAGRIPESDFKSLNEAYWSVTKKYFDKLKAKRGEEKQNRNLSEQDTLKQRKAIIESVRGLLEQASLVHVKKELDELSNQWKKAGHLSKSSFKEMQDQYHSVVRSIQEKQFLLSITQKKNKDFCDKTDSEKYSLLIKTLRNVLRRDQEELSSFSENLEKMTINKGSFVEMLESKLNTQKEKVELKKRLLDEYQSKLK